jgi:APA family basic amino acid/polyamine antiporter
VSTESGSSPGEGKAAEPDSRLDRRLGTGDAVVIGLGSMLGTGVFVVFAPAAARAGAWLLAGLGLAALVAYANATSSAQLAAVHPQAGGAYVYGRARLGEGWGALAGYAFVAGKIASCAAAALAVGAYAWPAQQRLVAALAVVAVTVLNLLGVRKTAAATRVIVAAVLLVLAAVVVAASQVPATYSASWFGEPPPWLLQPDPVRGVGVLDVLGAAGLIFFAFAGYARIATLGEEVRDPARTIPRAIPLALGIALLVYALVAGSLLWALGSGGLAASVAPLVDAVRLSATVGPLPLDWLVPVVRAGGALAALGVLVALVAGISRTVFAMAAEGDLPRGLAAVHSVRRVPHRAELLVGVVALVAVLFGGLVGAVAFSAFTVLLYYAVANAAALRLGADERRWPRALAWLGLVGCLVLAVTLPAVPALAGAALLAGLVVVRGALRRWR